MTNRWQSIMPSSNPKLAEDGITSAGWASFLQAVVEAGLAVDGHGPFARKARAD